MCAVAGVCDGETGVGYGTVEYWIRLRVPMDQALRLYKVSMQLVLLWMEDSECFSHSLSSPPPHLPPPPPSHPHFNQEHYSLYSSIVRNVVAFLL